MLGHIPGFLIEDTAAGSPSCAAHRFEHRPTGVDITVFPHRMTTWTLAANIQPRFDLLVAGPVDAEAGLGDAGRPMQGMTSNVQGLMSNRRCAGFRLRFFGYLWFIDPFDAVRAIEVEVIIGQRKRLGQLLPKLS